MKFGQDFKDALERDEFPREWIDSAIPYKKLKKCIKRVQQELLSFGLDQATLDSLWQHVGRSTKISSDNDDADRLLRYGTNGNEFSFTPKLTVAIDPSDGSPMDAWLSPETRLHLYRLAHSSQSRVAKVNDQDTGVDDKGKTPANGGQQELDHLANGDSQHLPSTGRPRSRTGDLETIEIPLTSDSEFFQILSRELANLESLQTKEKSSIQSDISKLGADLRNLKLSKKRRSKEELQAWRRIFELYTDAQIFLSSHEADSGARDVSHAQKQLQYFTKTLSSSSASSSTSPKFLGKEATVALDRFLRINMDLLRLMKFQEINRTALTKIMKKFDKQTALHARAVIPDSFKSNSLISQDLAKATCFTISEELLQLIPNINDYLCPVCFSVSYKPVRLQCNHVFCIRCLIVLQRAEQKSCPLCRSEVVMDADSGTFPSLSQRSPTLLTRYRQY
jgi:E3 ubiquitin-protein ligase BAH